MGVIDGKGIAEGRKVCVALCKSKRHDKARSDALEWFRAHQEDHVPLELLDIVADGILHIFDESLNWDEEEVEMLLLAMRMLIWGSHYLETKEMSTEKSNTKKKRVQITEAEFKSARNKNITKLLNICSSGVLNEEKYHFSLSATGLAHLMTALSCALKHHDKEATPYGDALQAELSKKFAFVCDCYTKMHDEDKKKFLKKCSTDVFDWDHEKSNDFARTIGLDVVKHLHLFVEQGVNPSIVSLLVALFPHVTQFPNFWKSCVDTGVNVIKSSMYAMEIQCRSPSTLFLFQWVCRLIDKQAMMDGSRQKNLMVCDRVELVDYLYHHKIEYEKNENYDSYATSGIGIWSALRDLRRSKVIAFQADHGLGALTAGIQQDFDTTKTGDVMDALLTVPVAVAQMRRIFRRFFSLTNDLLPFIDCPEAIRQEKAAKKHKSCQFNLVGDDLF